MNADRYITKWKEFTAYLNKKGIPAPTIRDPKTGTGSVSLTLVFISSGLVIVGIVGKWTKLLDNVDIDTAMQFFWTACTLYWGRKFQPDDRPKSTKPVEAVEAKPSTKIDDPDS